MGAALARLRTVSALAVTLAVLPAVVAAGPAAAFPVVLAEFPDDTTDADLPFGVGWGNPGFAGGAIGDGTTAPSLVPLLVNGGTAVDGKEVTQVAPGVTFSCAVAEASVYCWGTDAQGQLGNGGPAQDSTVPVPVGGPLSEAKVTSVAVGASHACAVTVQGLLYCWGVNNTGQLGLGTNTNAAVPALVGGAVQGKHVSAVSAGFGHTCAIAEAKAYCWGDNDRRQVGASGNQPTYSTPVAVSTSGWLTAPVSAISADQTTTCALALGRAYCWGDNQSGQAGVGSAALEISVPSLVKATGGLLDGLTVKAISTGSTTCAIAGKGAVRKPYCWGANTGGALGNKKTEIQMPKSSVPAAVHVAGALKSQNVSSISTASTACVTAGGQGYCWGHNSHGQIGDGSTQWSADPVQLDTSGPLGTRRLQTISNAMFFTAGVAVTARKFGDVKPTHDFYDDISWLAGAGVTQGFPDNTYRPSEGIERQAMAAFLFRLKNPGLKTPECDPMTVRLFDDVKTGDKFCGPIEWMVKFGIMTVDTTKLFDQDGKTTRAVMADWIFRAHHPKTEAPVCAGNTQRLFPDVQMGQKCGAVEWLAKVGVANGFADGTYRPDNPVSRDAMAAFFHRVAELNAH